MTRGGLRTLLDNKPCQQWLYSGYSQRGTVIYVFYIVIVLNLALFLYYLLIVIIIYQNRWLIIVWCLLDDTFGYGWSLLAHLRKPVISIVWCSFKKSYRKAILETPLTRYGRYTRCAVVGAWYLLAAGKISCASPKHNVANSISARLPFLPPSSNNLGTIRTSKPTSLQETDDDNEPPYCNVLDLVIVSDCI